MSKVKLLPPEVISKIAAGEIIERPASVIKELLENSLDSGATAIEIHLQDAGKKLIQIKDNGTGIEPDDLETIFLRHATSKIRISDDLFAIQSLGFRGEALYSIAAISDITLKSKAHGQEMGFKIHLRGGEKTGFQPCPFNAHGTEIEIKELFFNTPARRKFLKTDSTELNQIINIFTNYAVLHHNVRFLLTHQGKTLLDLAPTPKMLERISDTLNLNQKHMLKTGRHFDIEQKPHQLQLILGDINIKRTRRDMQFLFVNQRPVSSKNISFHMNKIYNLIMPEGSFPFFAVFLDVPVSDVDVNIHPAKREVKIKNEQNVCAVLRSLTEETLMRQSDIKQAGPFRFESAGKNDPGSSFVDKARAKAYGRETSVDYSRAGAHDHEAFARNRKDSPYTLSFPAVEKDTQSLFLTESGQELWASQKDSLQNKLTSADYIGSFINKYLLFENHLSLLVVDQHAAAERVTYEHLIAQIQKGKVETQMLLTPLLIKLTIQEMLIWEDAASELEKIGFSTSLLDKETIAVHSYPQLIKDIERSFRQLLSGETIATSDPDSIARRACRSSVMSGDRLSKGQALYLRDQLIQCLDPFTCPHGRPTVLEMNEDFMDKQFLRG